MTKLLTTQLKQAKTGHEIAEAVAFFQGIVGVEAEDDRETPLLFNRRAPYIFAGQEDFLITVQNSLDATHDPQKTVDLAILATWAANHAGLETSNSKDLAYTSLMILYARHRGAPDMARLYGEGLSRYLERRTTKLAHIALLYEPAPGNSDWKIFRGRC